MADCKPFAELKPEDLAEYPVWEFALDMEEVDESLVRPVFDLPVDDLMNRIVGTKVRLKNGTRVWSIIQNIDLKSPTLTRHFLALTLIWNTQRVVLARYHDYNQEEYGPAALARSLRLSVDEVFPITYDVSEFCKGDPASLTGAVEAEPKEKLTRAQIVKLAVQ